MLVLVAPRSARGMGLDALQEAADAQRELVTATERERLRDAILKADPGMVLAHEDADSVTLHARGRSGLTIRLGSVWHEVELPDWHEGTAGTWLAERFVGLLRHFPRVSGGIVLDSEEGHPLDPTQQAALVERYRYRSQASPDAPFLPTLDLHPDDAEVFAKLAEPVLRRRGASAADRAWFFARAVATGLDRDLPDDPVEVRYDPVHRSAQVIRYTEDGDEVRMLGRLAAGVRDDPPPLPDDLAERDQDGVAIAYLSALLTWS